MSFREFWLRLTYPFRKARVERDLREEMSLHVTLRAERLAEGGLSHNDAVASARKRFGNAPRIADASRAAWGWHWLDGFVQDTHHIARQLRRTPGFALVVCITIALGVAINATAFTFYDAVVLKPLPVADPSRVIRVTNDGHAFGFELLPFSVYAALRHDARTTSGVTTTTAPQTFPAVLPGHAPEDSRVVTARFATPEFAQVLGIHARVGRWFDASDDAGVVLDHAFWTTAFNADPTVVGRGMHIGNASFTIIGVADQSFAGTGMPAFAPNVWLTAGALRTLVGSDWQTDNRPHWQVLARLADNASLVSARTELTGMGRSIPDSSGKPLTLVARSATFFQTDAGEFEAFQQVSLAFLGALLLMLSIAIVNLVNLFAARNAARDSETTVRLVLGASRRRIARQLASESVLLALVGGALGLVASRALAAWIERWMIGAMASISGGGLGISLDLAVDWRVTVYAVLLSVGLGLAIGLWPALRATRGDVNTILRQGAAATASGAAWGRRHVLLVVQMASCIVLLTAAGVLLGGMRLSSAINPQFDADHMLVVTIDDGASATDRATRRAEIARRLAAVPSVRGVGWSRRVPFGGTHLRHVTGQQRDLTLSVDEVNASYFDAMGMPVVRGRTFTADEVERNAPVMLVSESAERLRWPSGSAVGRSVPPHDAFAGPDSTKAYTVIGVVPNIRSQFLSRMNGPAVYYAYGFDASRGSFLVRTRGTPESAMNDIRLAIASISPTLASRTQVVTMRAGPMALQQLMARLPAVIALSLALAGLTLASVGVYGVIAQIVTKRTREIGIHMALGAGRVQVVRLVAVKTLRPVAWGATIGAVGAVGLSLAVRSFIAAPDVPDFTFGAGAFSPAVFSVVLGALLVVVAAALIVPLRRAVNVDPVRTLRSE